MSDPLLPVPDADVPLPDREEAAEVDDAPQPDVLPGPGDDEDAEPATSTPYRTPAAGDRLDADELRADLAEE